MLRIRVSAITAAAVAVVVSPMLGGGGASADQSSDATACVTGPEFVKAKPGHTRVKVRNLFGTDGTFGDGGAGGFTRHYAHCGKPPAGQPVCDAVVEYQVGPKGVARLSAKKWKGACGEPA